MVRLKFGHIISDAKGKIGGSVFTRQNSCPVLRNKNSNSNKRSFTQIRQRQIVSLITKRWRSLTELQRMTWAKSVHSVFCNSTLNDNVMLNGFNYFGKCNFNLLLCGRPLIEWPPRQTSLFQFGSIDVQINYTAQSLSLNFIPVLPADTNVLVYATCPHGVGVTNVNKLFRLVMILDDSYASPYDCINEYKSVFGGIGYETQKIVFRFITVSTVSGLASMPIDRIVFSSPVGFVIGDETEHPLANIGFYNRIRLFPVTASDTGSLNYYKLFGSDRSGSGAKRLKCALYDNFMNLVPNSTSEEILVPIATQWMQLDIVGVKPNIVNGNNYWLAAWDDGVIVYINGVFPPLGTRHRYRDRVYDGVFPLNIPAYVNSAIVSPSFYGQCSI